MSAFPLANGRRVVLIRTGLLALVLHWVAVGSLAAQPAQLVSPLPGSTIRADETRFIWAPVAGASAYYVYVGSENGARDLAESGELGDTEFTASNLPGTATVHVRLWTQTNGVWVFVDYEFRTLADSRLILPVADSSGSIDPSTLFRWTSVSNATAYYLYIGTSRGGKDIVNSGETLALSRSVVGLPEGEHIFVRLWTKVSGQWYFNDYQFDVRLLRAKLIAPTPSTLSANPRPLFEWSPVLGAQAYYLYVGSMPGAKDVIDGGATLNTRFNGPVLAGATRYYVRLFTQAGGVWRFRDYEFRTAPIARIVNPALPGVPVIPGNEFSWSRVEDAEAYYLYIGSGPGQKNVVDTGVLQTTAFRPASLPGGETLHARLWTKHGGIWRFADESFITAPVPSFVAPRMGAMDVGPTVTLRWQPVRDAEAYRVELGSTPHGSELLDSGLIGSTELGPIDLPELPVIYGRVWARAGGVWRQGGVIFSTAEDVAAARLTSPRNLAAYAAADGFRWLGNPLAAHYRLMIGTSPGGSDVHDSGPIRSHRRFVDDLVPGVVYHATLVTSYVSGAIESTSIQFVGSIAEQTFESKFQAVAEAAYEVTAMAENNFFVPGSVLETVTRLRNRYLANCVDYASALLTVIEEMNVGLQARYAHVSLVPNRFDVHTLVEVWDDTEDEWVLVDPTFGVVPRGLDGRPTTSDMLSAYTRSRDWASVSYEYLGPSTEALLTNYYIDYPLLFTNVHDPVTGIPREPVPFVIDLYEVLSGTVGSSPHGLAARCVGGSDTATVLVSGLAVDLACDGPDRQTFILGQSQLELADPVGQSTQLLMLRRVVFD